MKKWMFLALVLFVSFAVSAQEKRDIVLETNVSEATVFIKGAQVVRKTTGSFPAGKSTVRLSGLSPYVDAKSVQVKMDETVMVLSVNYQLNYEDSIKLGDEIKAYVKQINDLTEKIKQENTDKEVVGEELAFMRENKKIGGTEGITMTNLKATSVYYGERMRELKLKESEIDKKIKVLSDEKSTVERKLSAIGSGKSEPSGEVVLNVDCKVAVKVPIVLSYYVDNAGWYPSYDIRAKSIADPVELVYKANIMQNTKEEWKNVKLKVSSGNPNLGSVAPKLQTYFLNYHTKAPRYDNSNLSNQVKGTVYDAEMDMMPMKGATVMIKGTTIATITDVDGNFSLAIPASRGELVFSFIGYESKTLPISNSHMNVVLEPSTQGLEEIVAIGYGSVKKSELTGSVRGIEAGSKAMLKSKSMPIPVVQSESQTMIEFNIEIPYTVLSENKNTIVELKHYLLPAEYEYYCVPKVDKDAFLLANISDWEQYNLLEGEANIFFENTYVGKTILDVRSQSDTLNISLGRDKSISVKREKIKEYTSRKFLGSKVETSRGWKINVKNNKSQSVSMVLFDQVPVSTMQEIEVAPEKLTDGVLNTETGEVKWTLTLQPQQSTEIDFCYKVKYPKGKALNVE